METTDTLFLLDERQELKQLQKLIARRLYLGAEERTMSVGMAMATLIAFIGLLYCTLHRTEEVPVKASLDRFPARVTVVISKPAPSTTDLQDQTPVTNQKTNIKNTDQSTKNRKNLKTPTPIPPNSSTISKPSAAPSTSSKQPSNTGLNLKLPSMGAVNARAPKTGLGGIGAAIERNQRGSAGGGVVSQGESVPAVQGGVSVGLGGIGKAAVPKPANVQVPKAGELDHRQKPQIRVLDRGDGKYDIFIDKISGSSWKIIFPKDCSLGEKIINERSKKFNIVCNKTKLTLNSLTLRQ